MFTTNNTHVMFSFYIMVRGTRSERDKFIKLFVKSISTYNVQDAKISKRNSYDKIVFKSNMVESFYIQERFKFYPRVKFYNFEKPGKIRQIIDKIFK